MQRMCNKKGSRLRFIYKGIIISIAVILIGNYLYHNSSLFYLTGITLPFSLHLNRQELTMIKGEEFHLTVFGINKRVYFSSTNFRVAGVNFNGRVFAYQTGETFIIAKVDKKQLKCRVHVIDINKKKLVLKKGHIRNLDINGCNSLVRWRSSDSKVASVNIFGRVKAKKRGYTVIKAKVKGKVLTCSVFVK